MSKLPKAQNPKLLRIILFLSPLLPGQAPPPRPGLTRGPPRPGPGGWEPQDPQDPRELQQPQQAQDARAHRPSWFRRRVPERPRGSCSSREAQGPLESPPGPGKGCRHRRGNFLPWRSLFRAIGEKRRSFPAWLDSPSAALLGRVRPEGVLLMEGWWWEGRVVYAFLFQSCMHV